jgi:spore maturation protein CgeB
MRIVMFYHSLVSDWNHGNAHFLRGIVSELLARGHDVRVYEEKNAWSVRNLLAERGECALASFYAAYPGLRSIEYQTDSLNLDGALDGADLVIVHEWNAPELVARIGTYRMTRGDFLLFFHDTHHRAASAPEQISQFDLSAYDGVLAFGRSIAKAYVERGWLGRAWTWHEAADTRVFGDRRRDDDAGPDRYEGDLVWIGNWGDEERSEELREFLLRPVEELRLKARVYGVRYPERALAQLRDAGIEYGGWLPNYEVARVFSKFRTTVHVPRRPYVKALPGIPTIRMFEALACGIPLVSAYWPDDEGLFNVGKDYLVAHDGGEMTDHLSRLINEAALRRELAQNGRRTILARHTCAHRVDELLAIATGVRRHGEVLA